MKSVQTSEKLIIDSKLPEYKVLFVCTGNTCRSPMAEVIYNSISRELGLNSHADSAGLFANGANISSHAKTVLVENGLVDENFSRRSVQISEKLCREADLIVGMTEAHAMKLIMSYPEFATKIKALDKEIGDPFGGYLETYRDCYLNIRSAIESEFFPELL